MVIKVITVPQLKKLEEEKLANMKLNTPFEELGKVFDISGDVLKLQTGMKRAKMSISHRGMTIR